MPEAHDFRALVEERTGLRFGEDKLPMLEDLFRSRMRETSETSAHAYLERLRSGPQETRELARRLTVSETYFLRNADQFRALESIVREAQSSGRRLRLLSAGCSSGEEPYSMAIATRETLRLAGLSGRRESREGAALASSAFQEVGIGASTGGPAAVLSVLRALPPSFPLPILLVVHISEPFGRALAEWLDGQVSITVRTVRDGERLPEPGEAAVLMAPPDRHLELRDRRLLLTDGPPRHSCRPSVDALFESLARELGRETIACLLTGMGRDGASGLLAIRENGGTTLAQDESTSVGYGMPGEAVRLGAAAHVIPLPEIGLFLARSLCPEGGARK